MDFGNTKYYNQKKRVITLRKGRGHQAGYVTMNGAKIVSRRPTVYYIMNNGAIRALVNSNIAAIPSGLKHRVLKGKKGKKPAGLLGGPGLHFHAKPTGNAAAKPKRKYTRKAGAFPRKPPQKVLNAAANNEFVKHLFNNVKKNNSSWNLPNPGNLGSSKKLPAFVRAINNANINSYGKNSLRNKRLAALVKARAAKKMHAKNLPGWYNTGGNLFGPIKANSPKKKLPAFVRAINNANINNYGKKLKKN